MNLSDVANGEATFRTEEIQFEAMVGYPTPQLEVEIWTQDGEDAELWHGPAGVIVNTSALEERKAFYQVITRK